MASTDHVQLSSQCLCQAHRFAVTVPRSSLPLPVRFCHCTSCRRMSGALYTSVITWPGSGDDVRSSSLKTYQFSASLSVLFCGTCSTFMFFRQRGQEGQDSLAATTGTLANLAETALLSIQDHIFVGDTVDGGASNWLLRLSPNDNPAPRWHGMRDVTKRLDIDWPRGSRDESAHNGGIIDGIFDDIVDDIPIQCHCRGVDLILRSTKADFAAMDPEHLPFFVEPSTRKSIATFDACNSCRLSFSTDIFNWTFSLLRHIDFTSDDRHANLSPFPRTSQELRRAVSASERDPRLGTLTYYASSPDVQRYFCSRCSAIIFYAVDDRPDLVDVAIGVLNSQRGSRLEERLFWRFGSTWGGKDDVAGGWREDFTRTAQESTTSVGS